MLRIRLFRTGKRHQPFFKIVVTDQRNPPQGGRFKDEVGFYNPLTKETRLKAKRIKNWIKKGAQPSSRVHNLLVKEGIIKEKKIAVHTPSKQPEGEEPTQKEKKKKGKPKPEEETEPESKQEVED